MKEWEIEVCKRNPEINQMRLDLLAKLDRDLEEMRVYRKFIEKKVLNRDEEVILKLYLLRLGLLQYYPDLEVGA